ESALAHIIASAEDQRSINARIFAFDLLMNFAGESIGVEQNQIFFKRFALCDYVSFAIKNQARTVEHQTVVSTNLIDEDHWHMIVSGNGGQHVSSQLPLPRPERR